MLWNEIYNTPEDNYRTYRSIWLNICANVSQIGMPCVLCGCNVPEANENLPERQYFTNIYYLAVVCDDETMMERITIGRGVTDENWIESSMNFNRWLKENASKTTPNIDLLDTSKFNPTEVAQKIDQWIKSKLTQQKHH